MTEQHQNQLEGKTESQTKDQKGQVKGIVDEGDYYDNPIDEEEADREYREQMKSVIAKEVEKETIVSLAIDLYNDYDFYPDIFRPHITVWIKWFEKYYKWDWNKAYYTQQHMEQDLRWVSHAFDEMQRKRALRLVLQRNGR